MTATETAAGWQLDENGAAAYERNLVPRFFEPFARDLLSQVELRPGQHLVDVACGTGVVARHAAQVVGPRGHVTAVDVSQAMLTVARRNASVQSGAPIVFEQADVTRLPLPDASIDVAVCQQGLQFFGDRPTAIGELRRVLKSGGRLGISTCRALEHQPGHAVLVDVLTRHVGRPAAQVTASPYALGTQDELEDLITGNGFDAVVTQVGTYQIGFESAASFLAAETSSSPLGLVFEQLDGDVRDRLIEDLSTALGPFTGPNGEISLPFQILTATTTR